LNNTIFRPGWLPTVLVLILIPSFNSLGIWQLRRAELKRELMARQHERERLPPRALPPAAADLEPLRYLPVSATGQYDTDHQFLLDNQIVDRRPGYRVLTPLRLADGNAVLVNRGWLPLAGGRSRLPALPAPVGPLTVRGSIDRLPAVGWRLRGADIPAPGWPAVVQLAEPARLAQRLGYPVLPYQVLLAAGESGGFQIAAQRPDLHPETSQGYALQWFSFAAAALIFYLWYGFQRKAAGKSTDTA